MSARARRLLPAIAALAAVATACKSSPLSDGIARPYDCNSCHGSAANSEAARGAPPRGLHGVTATTEVGVGAHQLHLRDTQIRQAIPCSECHVVPAKVEDPGHVDQPHATVTWGALASHGGTSPSWDRNVATCSSVYCHGATLHGGREPSPVWTFAAEPTFAGPPTETCTTCHGWPPPSPHTSTTTCNSCHPGTVRADGTIDIAGGLHIDGKLEVAGACSACHGSPANPAPPKAVDGSTSTTNVAVGAHQLHLRDTPIRSALACSECHVVPGDVDSPGHIDQPHATLTWGPLASHGTSPSWNRDAATCSAVYCHGATLPGGNEPAPLWTFAAEPTFIGPFTEICTTCHGWPPPSPHPALTTCHDCHPATVLADGTIDVAGGHHIDGKVDAPSGGACGSCHAIPPPTGAHLVHYGDTSSPPIATYGDLRILEDYYPGGAAYYMFGCGNCHPLDETKHLDGVVEVELYDATAPAGSLKAQASPSAVYIGGTCSGVYCHSSGQASPAYVTTPSWPSGTSLGCDGCHNNPPNYASGGAGAPDANGHVGIRDDGYIWGHFGGIGMPSVDWKHGMLTDGNDAAAFTCQTCHADTVDPSNTGSSGFYYLDTSGDYSLPGGTFYFACGNCHTGAAGAPSSGSGKVRPLHHVNGSREVVFDARTSLPSNISYLPTGANKPSRPYWVTNGTTGSTGPTSGLDGTTWSLTLGSVGDAPAAAYDTVTKTCSNVACHMESLGPVWGTPYKVTGPVLQTSCCDCHRVSICGF